MMMKKLCSVHKVALLLVLVGALNWGLVGAFNFDLVAKLLGAGTIGSRIVYVLVGLSAISMLMVHKCCLKEGMGGDKGEMMKKYMGMCGCGSGKKYGDCCGGNDMCPCGSGKKVSECCMKNPEAHKNM